MGHVGRDLGRSGRPRPARGEGASAVAAAREVDGAPGRAADAGERGADRPRRRRPAASRARRGGPRPGGRRRSAAARSASAPAEGGDGRRVDLGELAEGPRERLLDVGLGVADELPDELQAARGPRRRYARRSWSTWGMRGDRRADEAPLPADRAEDELLQLRPAVRLAQDPAAVAAASVSTVIQSSASRPIRRSTCQARSGSSGRIARQDAGWRSSGARGPRRGRGASATARRRAGRIAAHAAAQARRRTASTSGVRTPSVGPIPGRDQPLAGEVGRVGERRRGRAGSRPTNAAGSSQSSARRDAERPGRREAVGDEGAGGVVVALAAPRAPPASARAGGRSARRRGRRRPAVASSGTSRKP